jgi:hypothetical protein
MKSGEMRPLKTNLSSYRKAGAVRGIGLSFRLLEMPS